MKTYISIKNEQKQFAVTPQIKNLIRKACREALKYEKFNGDAEISVTLTDNCGIKELNNAYRGIDRETDVLSFPLGENGVYDINMQNNAYCLGDIVLSLEKAIEQAELYGHSNEREIAFLTVHSMLHLLGYDHVNSKDEEKIMFSKQEEILIKMGLAVKE